MCLLTNWYTLLVNFEEKQQLLGKNFDLLIWFTSIYNIVVLFIEVVFKSRNGAAKLVNESKGRD